MLKSMSFQPSMAAGSLAMGLLGIGPPAAGGLLGIVRAGVDAAVFYLHELGWEHFLDRPRRDSARTVDFRYFGTHS
jgi:uncharacterized membrane protein